MPQKRSKSAEWLDWEIEIGYHVNKRSLARGFNETDLRTMVADVVAILPSHVEGRFVLHARLGREQWRIVVEPDYDERKLAVVTVWRV
ncbi:MAG TPA: hypothetical protein PLE19_11875 [Planctomycetota bacterium]|nr:hypothetical protein [Planctomycetota bacterium]HRR81084.1 hypothetical protein [Planctomycetota bacterium]HRT94346.1 hypothetical protein [Planctomycetota bacterium]